MSVFNIEERVIEKVSIHPNADRLSLIKLEGCTYEFVTGKNEFKDGDICIYFPIDSLLSDNLSEHIGIKNFLSGKDKNRIKTVKLRGSVSQGVAVSIDKIKIYLENKNVKYDKENLTEILGVVKWEPPVYLSNDGKLLPLPQLVSKYDIEGCDNFPEVVNALMDKKVWISEKAEGTNYSITIDNEDKIFVNQRNHTIKEIEDKEHSFWKASRNLGLIEAIQKIKKEKFPDKTVTIRGELIGPGVQGNYYLLKDHQIELFDLELNGDPINVEGFILVMEQYGLGNMVANTIEMGKTLREWTGDENTIKEMSNGKSVINSDKIREGIVIKPLEEEKVSIGKFIGRLFLKQRSPNYLSSTDF